jgi:hypothetical protein
VGAKDCQHAQEEKNQDKRKDKRSRSTVTSNHMAGVMPNIDAATIRLTLERRDNSASGFFGNNNPMPTAFGYLGRADRKSEPARG